MLTVKNRSMISNEINEMQIDTTIMQWNAWRGGKLIQDAMPNATATQREFLLSGMSEAEQAKFYREE